MLQVSEALQEHGLDEAQIKFELFATADPGRRKRARARRVRRPAPTCAEATVILDGGRAASHAEKGTSRPRRGAREGMEVPYACKAGVCSTCRAMLVEGQADMDANYALEDYEMRPRLHPDLPGYPVSDRIVVDFDR